ncbi:hypothetical protein SteCoe_20767 [Stentor coeruleus]|uniref:Uncharacterized protein n=1 Tax=Stentor coeruleus TaxID=5963 RepID=A0A1R2BRC8_9CILI|nr:hypothetical protein SteCoe_20767 [Stentor coeruleus]
MDAKKSRNVKRSAQKSRQSEPESPNSQPLTLEDYLKKPSEVSEKLLPKETEERIITGYKNSKDTENHENSASDRRKKPAKMEEKLLVEEMKNPDSSSSSEEIVESDKSEVLPIYEDIIEDEDEYNDDFSREASIKLSKPKSITSPQLNNPLKLENYDDSSYDNIKVDSLNKVQENSGKLLIGISSKLKDNIQVKSKPPESSIKDKTLSETHHKPIENQDPTPLTEIFPIKTLETFNKNCQTDPDTNEKAYAQKLKQYKQIISTQSKELESLRKQISNKNQELQELSSSSNINPEKILKLKQKLERQKEETKKALEIANSKDFALSELKEKINSMVSKPTEISIKKNIFSDSEFWRTEDTDDRAKGENLTLKDISKGKALWINHLDEKKLAMDFVDKIKNPADLPKNQYEYSQYNSRGRHKLIRRSLEPLTPISSHKGNT